MPADQLLNTVLQYYQDVHDAAKTDQIIGTTAHLLTQLSNPLNLGVLTSQLLTAPAIWQQHDGLRTAIRIISIYNTAATRIREHEIESAKPKGQPKEGSGLSCEVWTRAVVKGADEYSKRWQHLLVLTGVLLGMEGNDRHSLSNSLRGTLEHAVVMAANMALETHEEDGPLAGASIVMTLNYAFPLLSDFHKAQVNCNALLPLTIWAITGPEGFAEGQFLHAINQNITEQHNVYSWDAQSPSFKLLQEMEKQPLMGNMGPLSKLAAYAAQNATITRVVMEAQDVLLFFTRKLLEAWQSNRFSDIDPAFEEHKLSPETMKTTYAALWQVLRKLMFAVVAAMQAIVSRSLLDPHMLNLAVASGIAVKSLHILRNIYFVSSRNGNSAFQVYTFAYLTSIDVLGRHPFAAEVFLKESQPLDNVPATHISRILDLFYLSVAEHLPLVLSTDACDALIIKPATNYLSHTGTMTPFMVELFESSHSSILAVLSCPQHSPLTIKITPFYIVKLIDSFPDRISPRQFRLAFKTVMQIVSPPFPIADMEPHMSETLLEMLLGTISTAAREPLPAAPEVTSLDNPTEQVPEPFSEQSALTMALVDALPYLPLPLVEEWLTITAQTLNNITDQRLRAPVKQRFWDILVNGEMDVERAAIGVAWWGTQGGRELVLFGGKHDPAMMSGALVSDERISSRL
ncbi:Peroxisomal biogenesis factor 8-like protein [Cladobotryum mycophilum]|uniref:Peroxisomal biogenesis factor 8-like protein n=1 Tax=Cladobotryum mycophilum TaxID=491253 RepID=A0ABR0SDB6_9HYPO